MMMMILIVVVFVAIVATLAGNAHFFVVANLRLPSIHPGGMKTAAAAVVGWMAFYLPSPLSSSKCGWMMWFACLLA